MRSMDMGPKLLAAFGAGMMLASIAFYVASLRRLAEPEPHVEPRIIPAVVPPAEPPPSQPAVVEPPPKPIAKPRPTQPTPKPLRPMLAQSSTPPVIPPVLPSMTIDTNIPELDTAPNEPLAIANTELPPPPPPQVVILPSGTLIQIRLSERLATDRNLEGDTFAAILDQPLVADGWVVAEAGSRVLGKIVELNKAGRVKGTASMTLALTSITTSDGQKIPIHTAGFVRKGDSSYGDDAGKIALGTAIGAVIGAAAGGGKGAAIGAASGGAAGAGTVLATRGKAAVLDVETRLSFRLDDPVTITERH